MNLTRPQLLLALLVLVGVGNVIWYVIDGWGLVTVHVHGKPLSQVAASIARQGHIRLRTNLDPATPVTLDFDKVPVAEAVDRLTIVLDAPGQQVRWRVAYLVGPEKRAFAALLDGWAAGKPDAAWRWIDRPLPTDVLAAADSDDTNAVDPRRGAIAFTNAALPAPLPPPPADATTPGDGTPTPPPAPAPPAAPPGPLVELQPLLEKAALFADTQVAVPSDWNPPVPSFSAKADAPSLFAKLARAGHSSSEEVFLVSTRPRRGPRPDTADGDAPQPFQNRMNPAAMDAALQGYVDRLPGDQRGAAQAQLDARRAQWKEMQGLTREQRRARFLAMMNDPNMQEQMQEKQLDREGKMTPEQKDARASHYVAAKAAATGK